MFSPWYAAARARRGAVPAVEHPAINVVLYRPRGPRWVMTERAPDALTRTRDALAIGASALAWEGDALIARFDERCSTFPSPWPARLRGTVRLTPHTWGLARGPVALDGAAGRHRWWPIAPAARAEVTLEEPSLSFTGAAYLDGNDGDRAVEADFAGWSWSRMITGTDAVVAYHTRPRYGAPLALARVYGADGTPREVDSALARLPTSGWGIQRAIAVDPAAAAPPRVVRTVEDTPFYARSWVETTLGGASGVAVHESLDAERFARGWVRCLLPFRSRRERGAI